jgi:SAM-dependent methyltransferase
VGVGTGRFAQALGVDVGVDPALRALRLAALRGVQAVAALGEALPFPDHAFGTVFVVVTICFADDPEGLLREARRVTSGGGVVLGIVPAESPWGRFYAAKGRRGHLFYSQARFFSVGGLDGLAQRGGLRLEGAASTLFQGPSRKCFRDEAPRNGVVPDAGFVALRYCDAAAYNALGR